MGSDSEWARGVTGGVTALRPVYCCESTDRDVYCWYVDVPWYTLTFRDTMEAVVDLGLGRQRAGLGKVRKVP